MATPARKLAGLSGARPAGKRGQARSPHLRLIAGGAHPRVTNQATSGSAYAVRAGARGRGSGTGVRSATALRPKTNVASTSSRVKVRPVATATVAGVVAALAVFIFGMVVLNIYVAESSFRLDHLQKQVAVQQHQYRQMRYQVALAQSPSRLADTAQKLGLTPPDDQTFLPGRQLEAPTPATIANSESVAGQHLKALLGKQS